MLTIYRQIQPQDCHHLAKLGYKTIICVRPDGESADQPDFLQIAKSACTCGIVAHYLPVNEVQHDEVCAFAKLIKNSDSPIFAYCQSGRRVRKLYQLAVMAKLLDE